MARLKERNSQKHPCRVSWRPQECVAAEVVVIRPEGEVEKAVFSEENGLHYKVRPYDVMVVRKNYVDREEVTIRYYCETINSQVLKLELLACKEYRVKGVPLPCKKQLAEIRQLTGLNVGDLPLHYKKKQAIESLNA